MLVKLFYPLLDQGLSQIKKLITGNWVVDKLLQINFSNTFGPKKQKEFEVKKTSWRLLKNALKSNKIPRGLKHLDFVQECEPGYSNQKLDFQLYDMEKIIF